MFEFIKTILCSGSRKSSIEESPDPCEACSHDVPPTEASEHSARRKKYLALDLDKTLIYTTTVYFENSRSTFVNISL